MSSKAFRKTRSLILFGVIILLSFQVPWCFAPPLSDFSSWQYQPDSQNPMQYTRQCHGDADGLKIGLSYVNTQDSVMYQSVFTSPGGDWPAYYPESINYDARVDFDRNFIVNDDDGDILSEYFGRSDLHIPPDCEQKLQLQPVAGPLSAETVYTIEWDWNIYTGYVPLPGDEDNLTGPFELSYSTGDGSDPIIIDTVTDATSYDWVVPNVNSTNCSLQIEDLSHPGLIDDCWDTFTILPWTGPVIGVDPNEFYFEKLGSDPDDQILLIWNEGGEVLHWQITEDCDWLDVVPSSGVSASEPNEVIVSVDTSSLESGGEYQCLLTVSDPNAINSHQTIQIHLTAPDCIKSDAPFYADWVGAGKSWHKPCCWCCEYQCRGDIDCKKVGLFRAQTSDLVVFAAAFSKGDLKLDQTTICADLDHKKVGLFRVQTDDLAIFAEYFSKGDKKVSPCPMDWDGDGDDDYNFWATDCVVPVPPPY